eukprot:s173_g4.t1
MNLEATNIEGHPDNVAPCIYGGFQLGIHNGSRWWTDRVDMPHGLMCVVFCPDHALGAQMRELCFRGRIQLVVSAMETVDFLLTKAARLDKALKSLPKADRKTLHTSSHKRARKLLRNLSFPAQVSELTDENIENQIDVLTTVKSSVVSFAKKMPPLSDALTVGPDAMAVRACALEAREGLAEDLCSEEISKTGASLDHAPRNDAAEGSFQRFKGGQFTWLPRDRANNCRSDAGEAITFRSKMIRLDVVLPSGRTEKLENLEEWSTVGELKTLVKNTFGLFLVKLVTAKGCVLLNHWETLKIAGLQDGDCLTALSLQATLAATEQAFAFYGLGDDRIVCWGSPTAGGVQATHGAFAAILGDGSVVTWGNPTAGGDSSAVQDRLKNVQQIQAANLAFAAILADGSVVTWGNRTSGGDCSAVQDRLINVQQVQATNAAFAAILADGSVVSWGHPEVGGDSSAVQEQLSMVQQVQATDGAFAAILANGSVVTWGGSRFAGDSSAVRHRLVNVKHVQATTRAFAAILAGGSVVAWGAADVGGDNSSVEDQLTGVRQIQASSLAFAAILADGTVIAWGNPSAGGDCSAVRDRLTNVQQVQATHWAFAALLADGSVITWGNPQNGGDSASVQDRLTNVDALSLLTDHRAKPWPDLKLFSEYYETPPHLRPPRRSLPCSESLPVLPMRPTIGGIEEATQVGRFPDLLPALLKSAAGTLPPDAASAEPRTTSKQNIFHATAVYRDACKRCKVQVLETLPILGEMVEVVAANLEETKHCYALAEAIRTCAVKGLKVEECYMPDMGAAKIIEAAFSGEHLETVALSGLTLSYRSVLALYTALRQKRLGNSLRHLTLAACGLGGDLELPPGAAAAYEKGRALLESHPVDEETLAKGGDVAGLLSEHLQESLRKAKLEERPALHMAATATSLGSDAADKDEVEMEEEEELPPPPVLLPVFHQLTHSRVVHLNLSQTWLSPSSLRALSNSLPQTQVEVIKLDECGLTDDAVEELALQGLLRSRLLLEVSLRRNQLSGNPGAISTLFHAVRIHARIAHLDLAENLMHPECVPELSKLLRHSVSLLCLHLLGCEDSQVEDLGDPVGPGVGDGLWDSWDHHMDSTAAVP